MNKKREFVLFATVSSISFWELRSTTPPEWYSRYSIEWSSSNIVALFFGGFLVPNGEPTSDYVVYIVGCSSS